MTVESNASFDEALKALGTVPAKIADAFAIAFFYRWSVDPVKVEKLLASRKQFVKEGESIKDAVAKFYGKDAAEAVERAIDIGV